MESQSTLRDTLEAAADAVEQQQGLDVEQVEQVTQESETAEQREARLRDERGRFVAQQATTEAGQQVDKQRPQRPSSWKKDYWEHWDKLDPNLAEYIAQREREYQTGVSTYKSEADRAKALDNAIAPYAPLLQANGLAPEQWVSQLGQLHYTLAAGTPQQKRELLTRLAQEFQVPLGEQQQQETNPEIEHLRRQLDQVSGQVRTWFTEQERAMQTAAAQEIARFRNEAPHLDEVRQHMVGLLQSGLASDLKSAYDMACRLDENVWSSIQEAKRAQEAAKAHAARAKASVVSVRTSTPGGPVTNGGAKGLRDQLEENFQAVASGRL